MNFKVLLLFFFWIEANAETLIGVVDEITTTGTWPISSTTVKIRTALKDYIIDFDKLDDSTKKQIKKVGATKKIQDFSIDKEMIKSEEAITSRANCTELPTDVEELETIANSSTDMLDFLQKIPQGSLQSFTFVTNSLSLHRGEKDKNGEGQVSPMWPRVLRSSIDGKTTISFVCDPKNPTFGKVEIIHFDDKDQRFKTSEFDFGHPQMSPVKAENRIHHNPSSCISCHGGSKIDKSPIIKPNWPEYFFWSDCKEDRGIRMYGSNDDSMDESFHRKRSLSNTRATKDCSESEDTELLIKEKADFKKFKEMQKNNPCFTHLPWNNQSTIKAHQTHYPYSTNSQNRNSEGLLDYSTRTNLRFTDSYSHLMSRQLASIISQSSEFEKAKFFLAMEAAECSNKEDREQFKKYFPKVIFDPEQKFLTNQRKPLLYYYAKSIGIDAKDWTMEFKETINPDYQASMPPGAKTRDLRIHDVVGGEILKNLKIDFINQNSITRGVELAFGKKFSCIDDLGGGLLSTLKGNPVFCAQLRYEKNEHLKKFQDNQEQCEDCGPVKSIAIKIPDVNYVEITKNFKQEQIERGRVLIEADGKGKCVTCHSASVNKLPKELRFISSVLDNNKKESISLLNVRAKEISQAIHEQLIDSKSMPPKDSGLTGSERTDIQAYILSLIEN